MKLIRLGLLCVAITGGTFVLKACCKATCNKSEFVFRFINFDIKDIDTALFVGYEANGQFNKILDSTFDRPSFTLGVDTVYYFERDLDLTHDYKVILPGIGNEYRVTNIGIKKEACMCSSGHFDKLASYQLNNTFVNSEYLDIKK